MDEAPFISIVLTGRNDDHGGRFARRLLRALSFNHTHLAEHGVDHEFVFVEWDPVAGRPSLLDLVTTESPDVASHSRWWFVDPRYTDACTLNTRLEYPEFHAKNVGIRRATGRFVLTSNCDVYLGREIVGRLSRQDLSPRTVYRAVRHDLAAGVDDTALGWTVLEDVGHYMNRGRALTPPLYSGATGDFVLLDCDSFRELRGFNEIYRLARVNVDLNFLVHARHHQLAIEDIGGAVYHSYHEGSYREVKKQFIGAEEQAPYGDDRWGGRLTYDNPSSWGLGLAPVRQIREQACWLDFDWRAVPELAPLSRLGRTAT